MSTVELRLHGARALLVAGCLCALVAAGCSEGTPGEPAPSTPEDGNPMTPAMPDAGGDAADTGTPPPDEGMPDAGSPTNSTPDAGDECVTMTSDVASAFESCPEEICPAQDSVCIPTAILEGMMVSQASLDELADCDERSKCVPAKYADTNNTFIQPTCTSVNGNEGRCLSTCIGRVAEQAAVLPQDTCADNELCTPCFDPTTGEDTGACHQGCDPGPTTEAMPFQTCCEDRGRCVEPALAGEQASSLGQLGCGDGLLCAPSELTDPSFQAAMCASLAGAEGRCLSTCLGSVADQVDQLPSEGCAEGERCAPCYDPITLEDTGACAINGDAPVDPPSGFASCCEDRGVCVTEALAGDQAESLAQGDCDADLLCTPRELTQSDFEPASCASVGGFEGRCLSTCLGSVADQVDRLPTEGCADNEVCAPCYDPITGEDTGACAINGDMPADAMEVFDRCCPTDGTDRGVCVPPELAGDQADSLPQDSCDSELLCAPTEKAQDPSFRFPSCEVSFLACLALIAIDEECDGACVPACIVSEDQASLLSQGSCQTGELCAPCVDPTTEERTGSCD